MKAQIVQGLNSPEPRSPLSLRNDLRANPDCIDKTNIQSLSDVTEAKNSRLQRLQLLKIPQVAKILNCGISTAYIMAQRGELPVVKIGASVRVPAEALEKWLASKLEEN